MILIADLQKVIILEHNVIVTDFACVFNLLSFLSPHCWAKSNFCCNSSEQLLQRNMLFRKLLRLTDLNDHSLIGIPSYNMRILAETQSFLETVLYLPLAALWCYTIYCNLCQKSFLNVASTVFASGVRRLRCVRCSTPAFSHRCIEQC